MQESSASTTCVPDGYITTKYSGSGWPGTPAAPGVEINSNTDEDGNVSINNWLGSLSGSDFSNIGYLTIRVLTGSENYLLYNLTKVTKAGSCTGPNYEMWVDYIDSYPTGQNSWDTFVDSEVLVSITRHGASGSDGTAVTGATGPTGATGATGATGVSGTQIDDVVIFIDNDVTPNAVLVNDPETPDDPSIKDLRIWLNDGPTGTTGTTGTTGGSIYISGADATGTVGDMTVSGPYVILVTGPKAGDGITGIEFGFEFGIPRSSTGPQGPPGNDSTAEGSTGATGRSGGITFPYKWRVGNANVDSIGVGSCYVDPCNRFPTGWAGIKEANGTNDGSNGLFDTDILNHQTVLHINHLCDDENNTNIERVMDLIKEGNSSPSVYFHVAKRDDPSCFILFGLPTGGDKPDGWDDVYCTGPDFPDTPPAECINLDFAIRKHGTRLKATGYSIPEHGDDVFISWWFVGDKGNVGYGVAGDDGEDGATGPAGIDGDATFTIGLNAYKRTGFEVADSDANMGMRKLPYTCYIDQFEFTRVGSANAKWSLSYWYPTGGNYQSGTKIGELLATGQGIYSGSPYETESDQDYYRITGGGTDSDMASDANWVTGWSSTGTPLVTGTYIVFHMDQTTAAEATDLNVLTLTMKKTDHPTLG